MNEEVQVPTYNLDDLQVIAKLIAATSQRGAIRAEEMVTVGALYNKTITILQASNAVPEEVTESNTEQEESND